MRYDAFISYSHAADSLLAPKLQVALTKLAKPWYRRRALSVFRDSTGLTANPGLWTSITSAMDDSEWFVFLASPDAAESPWVEREIEHWLSQGSVDRLLPVLTQGEWVWDPATNGFDRAASTAVPAILLTAFAEEPRHIDMRWAQDEEHLDLRHSRFRDQVAELAAPMHGLAKDELEGEDVRQHRRTLRIAWGAAAAMFMLLLLSGGAGAVAISNARDADRQRLEAEQSEADALAAEADALAAESVALEAEETAERRRLEALASADEAERLAIAEAAAAERAEASAAQARVSAAEARRQEGFALENASLAALRAREAIASRNEAQAARVLAEANETRALDGEAAAEKAQGEARANEKIALAAQKTAEDERQKAEAAQMEAELQRDLAVTEALARTSAATDGSLSLLLGVEAVGPPSAGARAPGGLQAAAAGDEASVRARQALIAAVARAGGAPDRHPVERFIPFPESIEEQPAVQWASVLSPGGTRLATAEFGGVRLRLDDNNRPTNHVPARIFVTEMTTSDPTVLTLGGHTDQIGHLAFADEARIVVSTDLKNEVRVWDAVTGELLTSRSSATAVVSPDGRFVLITATTGGLATEVIDAREREVTAVLLDTRVLTERYEAGSFSPDGAWAYVETEDGAALLDLARTRGASLLPLDVPGVTSKLPSVDPSGTIVTAVLDDSFLGFFSLPNGELIDAVPFVEPVADVAWGPAGSVVAAVDEGGRVSVLRFDDSPDERDVAVFVPTTYGVCTAGTCTTELSFSRTGRQLIIERSIANSGTSESELVALPADLRDARAVASYDGAVHAVGGPDDSLVFVERNLNDGTDENDTSFALEELGPNGSHTRLADDPSLALMQVGVSPDASTFAVATRDGRVRVWDLEDGSGPTEAATTGSPRFGLAFRADGARLIGVGTGPHTEWDLTRTGFGEIFEAGATDSRATLADDGVSVLEVDGNRIVARNVETDTSTGGAILRPTDVVEYLVAGRDGSTVYAILASGSTVVAEMPPGDAIVRRLNGIVETTSSDGRYLALRRIVRGGEVVIDVMRRDTFAVVQTIGLNQGLPAADLADNLDVVVLSPMGDQLAAVGPSGLAAVWDVDSGDLVEKLPGTSQDRGFLELQGLAYSPDGDRLVVKTPSNRVTLYDTDGFDVLASQQLEPQDWAGRVVWSPDGELVVVDGIFVFDGATLEPLGSKLAALPSTALRFSANGRYLTAIETVFTTGDDRYVVKRYSLGVDDLKQAACRMAGRNLTAAEWARYRAGLWRKTCP